MADEFPVTADNPIYPAQDADEVTPHDTTALGNVTKGVYVGGAGNLEVIMLGGETVVFSAVPAGTVLPIRATHVKDANTTATLIVALW